MNKNKSKIAIVTGTRAEFGIWKPVLAAVRQSKKLQLQLVVTGMHLQREFGYTLRDIEAEKIPIAAEVPMYRSGHSAGQSLAQGIAEMSRAFAKLGPDLVMVLGDRLEMLAAASTALACQIPIAHLHGGETAPGQWDEQIRHAVTKMAHLHFCATRLAGKRIAQMGEDPSSIHVVGAPAIDEARRQAEHWRLEKLCSDRYPTIVLHPSSSDEAAEYRRARMVLEAIRHVWPKLQFRQVGAVGPNNDPGHRGILRAYRECSWINLQMSLPQVLFWQALNGSRLLVGNSSAGILEAATFGCAVINLGERQVGRERHANVIDVPWSAGMAGIAKAIRYALTDTAFRRRVAKRRNFYGDGHAAERICRVLESLRFPIATVKRFGDLVSG
ncbi:MAG: UDP-N-acetylglucosamine 2-epimerase [Phycisphaerales bacterium]|nr:UDP-N-acetylglucosamine 2-epimerase [Phycisphaerales bacterium]